MLWFILSGLFVIGFSSSSSATNAILTHTIGTTTTGAAATQFTNPYGVTWGSNNDIIVADNANHRLQKWALPYTTGTTVAGTGVAGSSATTFEYANNCGESQKLDR